MKILVGMSGGVDSSTTALLLKEQGYEVTGAMMSILDENDIKNLNKTAKKGTHSACLSSDLLENIENARKIADEIGIDFHVVDCSKEYKTQVLENFKKEYLKGRTPNPCVLCNSNIKFGAFPKLAKGIGLEFDKFATGHYARIEENKGKYIVKKGISPKKDQSYFLYRLNQEQLSKIMFPLGGFTKDEIREKAKSYGLKVADKPDSQDFYDGNYNELLNIGDKEGNIVDTNGKILGKHKGIWNYTIGQRRGLLISAKEPLYVIKLKADTNEVVVGFQDKTMNNRLIANNLSWINPEFIEDEMNLTAKIRSTQSDTPVKIKTLKNGMLDVEFENMQKSIAKGQSIVFYQDDILLGGGIIDEVLT